MHAIGSVLQGSGVAKTVIVILDLPLHSNFTVREDGIGSFPAIQKIPVFIGPHNLPGTRLVNLPFNCCKRRLEVKVISGVGTDKGCLHYVTRSVHSVFG